MSPSLTKILWYLYIRSMQALAGIDLKDFTRVDTGYTNRYLESRNDLKTPYHYSDTPMYVEQSVPDQDYIYSVTKDLERTPLFNMFFSQKNLDYLQQKIKEVIKTESGHTIGRQSDIELLIIMRSYYFQDAANLDYDIPRQVAYLNWRVVKYAVYDQILPKVKSYQTFLNDNVRTNVVLERERHVSQRGSRINRGFADLI
jgi:hypothetical protein